MNPDLAEAYINRGAAKAAFKIKDEVRKDFETALELTRKAGDVDVLAAAEQSFRELDDAEDS